MSSKKDLVSSKENSMSSEGKSVSSKDKPISSDKKSISPYGRSLSSKEEDSVVRDECEKQKEVYIVRENEEGAKGHEDTCIKKKYMT